MGEKRWFTPEDWPHFDHNITVNHSIHESGEITPFVGFSEGGYVIGDALWDGDAFQSPMKFSDMLKARMNGYGGFLNGHLNKNGGLMNGHGQSVFQDKNESFFLDGKFT